MRQRGIAFVEQLQESVVHNVERVLESFQVVVVFDVRINLPDESCHTALDGAEQLRFPHFGACGQCVVQAHRRLLDFLQHLVFAHDVHSRAHQFILTCPQLKLQFLLAQRLNLFHLLLNLLFFLLQLLVFLGNQPLPTLLCITIGYIGSSHHQQDVERIGPPRSIPRRQDDKTERRLHRFLTACHDDSQMEGVGAFMQIGVLLDAAACVRTPLVFSRAFQPVAILYGFRRVVVISAILQSQGVVAPGNLRRLLATIEQRVGIVANIDIPDVRTHMQLTRSAL